MKWVASLSNGETVVEREVSDGEASAWQQLLSKLRATPGLRITRLRLQSAGRTVTSTKDADGYFQAYEVTRIMGEETQSLKQGIGSIYGDTIFITWVDSNGEVWQDVRSVSAMRVHTTLS